MNKQLCELCGLPITKLMRHFSCKRLREYEGEFELDTKDIRY